MNLKNYPARAWIISNPRILWRIARGFTRALLFNKNTLRTVHLLPTFDCQAKCEMCSVAKFNQGKSGLLTLADYDSIAEQSARMGAIAATFLGGEPLLVRNLDEIIRLFKSRHFFISLVSNGIAATRDRMKTLRSAGLDAVFFGLETLDEKVNDTLRGFPGQCGKVLHAIQICQEEGLLTGLCTVLFPGEVDRYIELAEFCRNNNLQMALPSLAGVGAAEEARCASNTTEYEEVIGLMKRYPHLSVDWAFSYSLKPRCPSGKEKIAITCYGDVLGCTLNHISFGNIKKEPLQKIWRRAGQFSQFKKNSDRCLAAFDSHYIRTFLGPIARMEKSPVPFQDHPSISPEEEPGVFL